MEYNIRDGVYFFTGIMYTSLNWLFLMIETLSIYPVCNNI